MCVSLNFWLWRFAAWNRIVFNVIIEYNSDRKSTRLNSQSRETISYAVFCLKKKKKQKKHKKKKKKHNTHKKAHGKDTK